MTWIGFFISIVLLLLISRKSLPLALFTAGICLGLFTLPINQIAIEIWRTLTDPSIILLAIAMGIIPLIGGSMKQSGQMDDLVNNLRIGKKSFLGVSPALMGMLPMPGGALLSAPLVEKSGANINDDIKVAINVWFRHLVILIYPLSPALIASAKIAGLEVYKVLPYLLPWFLFIFVIGYIFYLKNIKGEISYTGKFRANNLFVPLCIILLAPLLDFILPRVFKLPVREIATVIGVLSSLILSWSMSRLKPNMCKVAKEMKPWNFTLIIIGMFVFLNIFKASDAAKLIAELSLSKVTLCIVVGFILGFVTGRIQLPASIVLPIYLTSFKIISPFIFGITYFSIFLGYLISPVHPCVSVSCEYFKIGIRDFLKVMAVPIFITIGIVLIVGLMFLK